MPRLLVPALAVLAVFAARYRAEAIAPDPAGVHAQPTAIAMALTSALTPRGPEPLVAPLLPLGPEPPRRVDVTLYNENTLETVTFSLPVDGFLEPELSEQVAAFFRCKRTGRKRAMAPQVMAMLADLAEHYEGHVIEIISGYRATGDSRKSQHRHGRAIDLRVRGISIKEVRDYLWQNHSEVGVGYYQQQRYVHIDHRPGERDTAWTQPRFNAGFQYNPRWARLARR